MTILKYFLIIYSFSLNLNIVNAQCCSDFFQREPLSIPTKSCSVFQTLAKTNKEELILTVSRDSLTNVLTYKYHQEFYIYSGAYYDPGFSFIWLNVNNAPVKKLRISKDTYNGTDNYLTDYSVCKYDTFGKLISFIEPDIIKRPEAIHFNEEFIFNSFEKEFVDSTINYCRSDYTYNPLGMIESVKYYSMEGDTATSKWLYDEKNRLVKKEFFKNGRIIEEITSLYKDGYVFSEYFVYDYQEGKVKRENQIILLKVKFENNKLVYQAFSSDGVVRNETIYKYSAAGDIVECIYYNENKILDRVVQYKY